MTMVRGSVELAQILHIPHIHDAVRFSDSTDSRAHAACAKVPGRDLTHGRKRCIGLAQSREATLGEHSVAPEGVVMHV
jgi:hypothetical protein